MKSRQNRIELVTRPGVKQAQIISLRLTTTCPSHATIFFCDFGEITCCRLSGGRTGNSFVCFCGAPPLAQQLRKAAGLFPGLGRPLLLGLLLSKFLFGLLRILLLALLAAWLNFAFGLLAPTEGAVLVVVASI